MNEEMILSISLAWVRISFLYALGNCMTYSEMNHTMGSYLARALEEILPKETGNYLEDLCAPLLTELASLCQKEDGVAVAESLFSDFSLAFAKASAKDAPLSRIEVRI